MRKRLKILVAIVVLAAAVFMLRRGAALARVGVGYTAEQTCACLYISGRTLESCRRDLEPLARLIPLRSGDGGVTARVAGVARAQARYTVGSGCTLIE